MVNETAVLNKEHYDAQMTTVIKIHGYKEKGLSSLETAWKVGLGEAYIKIVYGKTLEEMKKYWGEVFDIPKKEYEK